MRWEGGLVGRVGLLRVEDLRGGPTSLDSPRARLKVDSDWVGEPSVIVVVRNVSPGRREGNQTGDRGLLVGGESAWNRRVDALPPARGLMGVSPAQR